MLAYRSVKEKFLAVALSDGAKRGDKRSYFQDIGLTLKVLKISESDAFASSAIVYTKMTSFLDCPFQKHFKKKSSIGHSTGT